MIIMALMRSWLFTFSKNTVQLRDRDRDRRETDRETETEKTTATEISKGRLSNRHIS